MKNRDERLHQSVNVNQVVGKQIDTSMIILWEKSLCIEIRDQFTQQNHISFRWMCDKHLQDIDYKRWALQNKYLFGRIYTKCRRTKELRKQHGIYREAILKKMEGTRNIAREWWKNNERISNRVKQYVTKHNFGETRHSKVHPSIARGIVEETTPGLTAFERLGMAANDERLLCSWQSCLRQMQRIDEPTVSWRLSSSYTGNDDDVFLFSLKLVNGFDGDVIGFFPTPKNEKYI